MSIKRKILLPVTGALLIAGIIVYLSVSSVMESVLKKEYENKKALYTETLQDQMETLSKKIYKDIESTGSKALEICSLFSKTEAVIQAFKVAHRGDFFNLHDPFTQKAREMLRAHFARTLQGYSDNTGAGKLKLHFHLPNARSLARLWRKGWQTKVNGKKVDISDDISGFRNTVRDVNKTKKPVTGIEIGRGGFVIRGLAPVKDNKKHYGSVEVLFTFNDLIKLSKTDKDLYFVVYMNREYLPIAKSLQNENRYPVVYNKFVRVSDLESNISSVVITENLLLKGNKNLVMEEIKNYYLASFPVKDYSGKPIGVIVAMRDISQNQKKIEAALLQTKKITRSLEYGLLLGVVLFIGIIITLLVFSIGFVISPIAKATQMSIEISRGNLEVETGELNSKDEAAVMIHSFKEMLISLKEKSQILEQIADGDLCVEVSLSSEKDNLGQLLDKMVVSLNDKIAQVNVSVEQVASGSYQLAQASQELSQGAARQVSSLEVITSSVTEISGQARQNADNAIEASGLARQAMENAENGNKQMEDIVIAMEGINRSADEIKRIVKVIDDIARQTNLLALNANVEAARAGKYGEGFAVVAGEVRDLASRSALSVRETTEMVEEAIKNITQGSLLVEATARQLKEITDSSSKMTDLVEEIALASREQTRGLDRVKSGFSQIEQVTQSNMANAEESASIAEELSSQAQQLKAIVLTFKLKNRSLENQPEETHSLLLPVSGGVYHLNNSLSSNTG